MTINGSNGANCILIRRKTRVKRTVKMKKLMQVIRMPLPGNRRMKRIMKRLTNMAIRPGLIRREPTRTREEPRERSKMRKNKKILLIQL